MVEDIGKEYRDTMQEIMLELKFSTTSFLNKFKDGYKKAENENLEIPVIISLKGKIRDFEIEVFGLGDKIKAPLLLEVPSLKNTRLVNQNTTIVDGLILLHGKNQFFNSDAELESKYSDYHYILFASRKTLNKGINFDKVIEWFQGKILSNDCKLKIYDKEINTAEELKVILREIFQN